MSGSEGAAGAAVLTRDVVIVEGPDAERYLQGQLSQDIDRLAVATSAWSLILQPQGKVDAWVRVTKVAIGRYLLDVDAGHGPAVEARLRRFLMRTDATITTEQWPCVSVRGPVADRPPAADGVLRLPIVGPGVEGYDLLGHGAERPPGASAWAAADLAAHDVMHGIPTMGRELTADTIPAEIGQWFIDASVSFTKGCYTGQELTARIDSRGGNVPRHLRVIPLDGDAAEGDEVIAEAGRGVVTSVARTAAGEVVVLALCGRAIEVGDAVTVGPSTGTVQDVAVS